MGTFFAMNGYGYYIWSAYGMAALALTIEIIVLRSRRKAALDQARRTALDSAIEAAGASS